MSFLSILLIFLILISLTLFIVFFIVTQRRIKDSPIATKYVVNYLSRFNNGHGFGRLIGRPVPVGNNRQLIRLIYRTNHIDDYGTEITSYETVIANREFMIETPSKITILPKSGEEFDPMEIESKMLKDHIIKSRDFNVLAKAGKESYDRLSETFLNYYGGQLYAEMINSMMEHIKNMKMDEEKKNHD